MVSNRNKKKYPLIIINYPLLSRTLFKIFHMAVTLKCITVSNIKKFTVIHGRYNESGSIKILRMRSYFMAPFRTTSMRKF